MEKNAIRPVPRTARIRPVILIQEIAFFVKQVSMETNAIRAALPTVRTPDAQARENVCTVSLASGGIFATKHVLPYSYETICVGRMAWENANQEIMVKIVKIFAVFFAKNVIVQMTKLV